MNRNLHQRSWLVVLLVFLGLGAAAQNPQYYNLNTSTGSNAIPLGGGGYATNKCQFLYAPNTIFSNGPTGTPPYNGLISTVYFRVNSYSAAVVYSDFTVSLVQNAGTSTSFPSTTFGTLTPAFYQATYSLPALNAGLWCAIPLQTPFLYDPSLSLILELKASGSVGGTSTSNGMLNSSNGPRLYGTYAATTGTTSATTLVDFGFDLIPSGPCTAPPTAGTASVSNATPCLGQSISLNLTGNSYGTGQSYQWQEATSASGPWTDIGAALTLTPFLTYTPTAAGSYFYQVKVKCGSDSVYSNTVGVTVPVAFPGGTYTIDPNIPASATNFQSFSAAISAIGCGISGPIVFNVANDTFNEQVIIPATVGSTATNTVTFNGNGALLTNAGTATNFATLSLNGADYFTFNNLNITSTGATSGTGVYLGNAANNNTFDSCNIEVNTTATGTTLNAVVMSSSPTSYSASGANGSNNTFSYCNITGGYYGVCFYGSAVSGNANNQVLNCNVKDFYLYGIFYLQQGAGTIANNIVERPTRGTISTLYGIYLSTGCNNSLVERNIVRNGAGTTPNVAFTAYVIYVSSAATATTKNKVYNNQIYNIGNSGTAAGLYLPSATHIEAYHNSISLENTSATTGTVYGIYSTGTAGVDLKNNNIYINQGGTTKYGIYFSGAGKTSNYNNIFVAGTGTNNVGYFSVAFPTLANWQGANSNAWDQNSLAVDPLYVNAIGGNLTPTNSFLDNMGTPVGVATDFSGAARSVVTPDIGAIEFSVPPCSGTPVAGSATTVGNLTSACTGAPITLSLNGFTIGIGISIQWEESPAGAGLWSAITGATNSSSQVVFNGATDYRAVVTCANGGGFDVSNTVSIAPNPFYQCYCSPLTGVTLHGTTANYITNVTIPFTTLNVSTSAVGGGGYTQHNFAVPANTASLIQGQTYTLNASITSASYPTELWIDWDQSGTFDSTEYTPLPASTTPSIQILVPATSVTGLTGMRLRNTASTSTLHGMTGACLNITNGRETEDFVINIVPGVQCSGIPSITGDVSASDSTLCNGMTASLALSNFPQELGITFQWESSPAGLNTFTPISGATGFVHTSAALSADIDYRVAVTCNNTGGGTGYTNVLTIFVDNPQITSSNGATRCGVGTVNLSATASPGSQVNWYANATGGSPLATNAPSFVSPVIGSTTTYYAAANAGGMTGSAGIANRISTSTNSGYADLGLVFDALSPFTLQSVAVYPVGSGSGQVTATIELKNSTGAVLQTTTVNLNTSASPGIKTVVPLNFNVPAGTNHRLVFQSASGGGITGFIRETTGFTYPYTTPGIVSITSAYSSGATNAYYYYFYDWQIVSGCEGTRVPVVATVTTPPAYTLSATPPTICTAGSSTISISSVNNYTYTWTPTGSGTSFSVSPTTTTKYYVSGIDGNNCGILDSITINVVSPPPAISAVASPSSICVSGSTSLSLNPTPMPGLTIQWEKNTGAGYTAIPGATNAAYTEPVTATTYYRALISCNSNLVATSVADTVTYSNPSLLNTFPGSRCGTGPVTLAAQPAAGVNVKWYNVATGGTSLANGNAFTSPSISNTTTYYAEPISGLGGNDSLNLPLASGSTTGSNFHMFLFSTTTGLTLNSIGLKVTSAVNTATSWDIFYRPNNYQLVPGANTSSAGWTLLASVTNAISAGASAYTTIVSNLGLVMPPNSTYSFHVVPVNGAHQYATTALGTTAVSNTHSALIGGHRGSGLFNCTASGGMACVNMGYSLGCTGTRVPVTATINPAASGTGLATGGTTTGASQGASTVQSYTDACNDTVAVVASGATALGTTSAIVLTSSTVQTHQNKPFVPRAYDIAPATNGPATVTLYALQSEFTAYNNYVNSNSLALPLLPTGPTDVAGMSNIVITQYHGSASAGNQGPLGLYSSANVSFIQNSAITVTPIGSYWKLTFPVTGFSGFFIHTGATPLAIDLKNITAVNVGSRNRIDWSTASETSGDRFELERSIDGSFVKLADINAKGQPSAYSYWDETPVTGVNYYRIKMVDAAGRFSYSKTVSATVKSGTFTVQAYPNPVGEMLTVQVFGEQGADAKISINDITGKLIRTIAVTAEKTMINMSGMAQGMYLIQYTDATHSQTIKVNKQ